MKQQVIYTECPRDAMQGWPQQIPTNRKIAYLQQLLDLDVDIIDAVSFVSPKLVPQMADSIEVLKGIEVAASRSKLLAIAANLRGVETACLQEKIAIVGYPFSISETFQMRNANKTIEESVKVLLQIKQVCDEAGKDLTVYISMAFGNPYSDPFDATLVAKHVQWMCDAGIESIVLSDTVGIATPEEVFTICSEIVHRFAKANIGAHLHCRPETWQPKLGAALRAGCVRIDGAINGIGGCPMAGDDLVGNLDTVFALPYLAQQGYRRPVNEVVLKQCIASADQIFNGVH